MTDIVEILRDPCFIGQEGMRHQAAAEIERLRAELHSIIDIDHHNHGPESQAAKLARKALSAGKGTE